MTIANCRLPIANLRQPRNRHIATSPHRHAGFTLIEMAVVIAIIILLTGLVVPAATQMWRGRKIADAQNIITGMLMTARARAIQSGGAETGLFFFVDSQGVQRVAPISQDPNDSNQTAAKNTAWQSDPNWYNVFTVSRDRSFTLPAPMRVVPRYAICGDTAPYSCDGYDLDDPNLQLKLFSAPEIANNDPLNPPQTSDPCQRHRNFFTLIFSPNGELKVGRDVILRDLDDVDIAGQTYKSGDVTGLPIWDDEGGASTLTFNTWNGNLPASVDPVVDSLDDIVIDDNETSKALNFPSVDGLLVYDDSLFNEAGDDPKKLDYMISAALPFYINRITGAVVRGPSGEAPTP